MNLVAVEVERRYSTVAQPVKSAIGARIIRVQNRQAPRSRKHAAIVEIWSHHAGQIHNPRYHQRNEDHHLWLSCMPAVLKFRDDDDASQVPPADRWIDPAARPWPSCDCDGERESYPACMPLSTVAYRSMRQATDNAEPRAAGRWDRRTPGTVHR